MCRAGHTPQKCSDNWTLFQFKANKFSPVAVSLNTVPILTPRGEKISYFFVSQKLSYVIAVSPVATLLNNCREPSYCSSRGGNIVFFFLNIYINTWIFVVNNCSKKLQISEYQRKYFLFYRLGMYLNLKSNFHVWGFKHFIF